MVEFCKFLKYYVIVIMCIVYDIMVCSIEPYYTESSNIVNAVFPVAEVSWKHNSNVVILNLQKYFIIISIQNVHYLQYIIRIPKPTIFTVVSAFRSNVGSEVTIYTSRTP